MVILNFAFSQLSGMTLES